MWLWGILICGPILAWLSSVYVTRLRLRHFKCSWPLLPVIGNLNLVLRAGGCLYEAYTTEYRKHGDMFLFFLGVLPVIVTADHQVARDICIKQFRAYHDRPPLPVVSNAKRVAAIKSSILNARGSLWTTLRAAAQPVFHTSSLARYASIMNDTASQMVDRIAKLSHGDAPFELSNVTGWMTIRVVLQCALGLAMTDDEDGTEHPAVTATKIFLQKASFGQFWTILLQSFPEFLHPLIRRFISAVSDMRELNHARDVYYSMSDQLARNYCLANGLPPYEKDLELLGKGADIEVFTSKAVPSDDSIIAAMMRATVRDLNTPLLAYEVLQQANTFIAAGYETTSNAVQFAVYLLARHPEAEAKLLAEIDARGRDVPPTFETYESWEYTLACLKESLRLYPIAPVIPRLCLEDTVVAGRRVPRGTAVHVNVMQMHRDPANFPDPDAFRPERFVEAAAQGNPNLHPAYTPFGQGPRNCIGWRMAMEEGAIMLIRMYQRFLFRLSDTHHPGGALRTKMGITLASVGGVWVKAIPR